MPIVYLRIAGNYWKDRNNRREFFVNFAKQKGFDALIASNWFSRNPKSIIEAKVQFALDSFLTNVIEVRISASVLWWQCEQSYYGCISRIECTRKG